MLMCLGLFLLAISDYLKQCLGTKGLEQAQMLAMSVDLSEQSEVQRRSRRSL